MKVGRLLHADGPQGGVFCRCSPFKPSFDDTCDGTMRSIEDSLQRLGLPSIDIVYIHDIAEDVHGPVGSSFIIRHGWRGGSP